MIKNIDKIIWYVPIELNHSSYVYTAVLCFCEKYFITFEVSSQNLNKKGRVNVQQTYEEENKIFEKVCYIRVCKKDNTSLLIAFDSYDLPYFFSKQAYETADVVLKRSYQKQYIQKLPEKYQKKTLKFGLPFMVRPNHLIQPAKFRFYYTFFNLQRHLKIDRNYLQRLFKSLNHSKNTWSFFVQTRSISEFEYRSKEEELSIFYQKRLFPYENSDDVKTIHEERIVLVDMLKHKYKKHFKGGVKKDKMSIDKCPQSLSDISSQQEFLKAFKRSEICVYTRGLAFSTGWTLSEFLAQGKCIVGEKLYNELPEPLQDGKEISIFESQNELVVNIDSLLDNKNKRDDLKTNALKYYRINVSPNNFIENLINRL
jgi:hypothetical protein